MSNSIVSFGEIGGAIIQGGGTLYNMHQFGIPANLAGADAVSTGIGSTITLVQDVLQRAGIATQAYYLGIAGIGVNLAAFELARVQMAQAQTAGDSQAYYAAAAGAISAGFGVIAGIPLLPPQVKGAAVALNLGFAFVKEGIANGADIKAGAAQAWEDMQDAWNSFWGDKGVSSDVNNGFRVATNPPRRDPLAIDLDGDGIETTGIPANGNPVLFDHDADGTKTGTGWVKPDDAWLVLDRDGNGSIDTGRELFGVDTMIDEVVSGYGNNGPYQYTVSRNAKDGFEALRALDKGDGTAGSAGYGDQVFDARDAAFANVRLWQDLNQDGVSQSNELVTLASKGIVSISLNPNATPVDLGNGNTVTGSAGVTFASGGHTQVSGVNLAAGNLNLADNPFYRRFTDSIPLTSQAMGLPEMGGSGWLRDLREAMSLGTPKAATLVSKINSFSAVGTRDAQMAQLDSVIDAWAQTTGRAVITPGGMFTVHVTSISETSTTRTVRVVGAEPGDASNKAVEVLLPAEYYVSNVIHPGQINARGTEFFRRLGELEAYNGTRFVNFTATQSVGSGGGNGSGGSGGGSGGQADPNALSVLWRITLSNEQIASMNAAYDALRESVYQSLALQTRLRPYLDAVNLIIDDTGIRFDAAPLAARFDTYQVADLRNAMLDLVDLNRYAQTTLQAVNFDGLAVLRSWTDALSPTSPLHAELGTLNVFFAASQTGTTGADIFIGDAGANSFTAGDGNDVVDGGAGVDTLDGGGGDDTLVGGAGNDTLYGGNGSDTLLGGDGDDSLYADGYYGRGDGDDRLDGGAGNDFLHGGVGSETYLFGRGDGQDTINNDSDGFMGYGDTTPGKVDTLQFKAGIATTDVVLSRSGNDLLLKINGTTDQVRVQSYFVEDGFSTTGLALDRVRFDSGESWGVAQIKMMALQGSDGDDVLYGYASDDTINGGAGNDYISGADGNDTLNGGAGNDTLLGDNGNDTLDGGAGNDQLYGGLGNNTYVFSTRGSQDLIHGNFDDAASKLNTLLLVAITRTWLSGLTYKQAYDSEFGGNGALELSFAGTTDKITINGFFYGDDPTGPYNPIQNIRSSDARGALDVNAILTRLFAGTAGDDVLRGTVRDDAISGSSGNDTLNGAAGSDVLSGGAGNDYLYGEVGNDTLDGGAGNDQLYGGAGDNTFLFGTGDGQDVLHGTWDSNAAKLNTLQLKAGIDPSQLVLKRVYDSDYGSNSALEVSVAGSTEKITVNGFFYGNDPANMLNPLQQIRFNNGAVWDLNTIAANTSNLSTTSIDAEDSEMFSWKGSVRRTIGVPVRLSQQVDGLISAMASFAPSAPGHIATPTDNRMHVHPALAVNWQ